MAVTLDWSIVFQSTLPHGERPEISNQSSNSRNFNPRSRMGSDAGLLRTPADPAFQSTLPHGERLKAAGGLHRYLNFNPRSRMGSDDSCRRRICICTISIHAPAWGATVSHTAVPQWHPEFQSTLPHGERRVRFIFKTYREHFNPRSRMGSDGTTFPAFFAPDNFNPRSRMGSDSG